MSYVPPANRSNQHIQRYRAELYAMPKSDKTGHLTRITQAANDVLRFVTYKYRVGMRVYAVTYDRQPVIGEIRVASHNLGINEYVIRDDNGKRYTIAENGVKFVLSIVLSNQHTQDDNLAA